MTTGIRAQTPPRQVLSGLNSNTTTPSKKLDQRVQEVFQHHSPGQKRSRTPENERIGPDKLSELKSPARYHHPSSMLHWSNKNRKGLRGKEAHTMVVGDSPEKEIRSILEHLRGNHAAVPFTLPSGKEVRWERNGFGVYSGEEKIREWGAHKTQDGRIISFPKEGRNLAVFRKNTEITPVHLAEWSKELQESGEDPLSFVRKKLFSPDGNSA